MSRRNKELSMRKICEIIRPLKLCGLGNREVGRSCNVSHTVVNRHIARLRASGLSYARIEEMDDEELRLLLKGKRAPRRCSERPLPDWSWVHREMRRRVSVKLTPSSGRGHDMPYSSLTKLKEA